MKNLQFLNVSETVCRDNVSQLFALLGIETIFYGCYQLFLDLFVLYIFRHIHLLSLLIVRWDTWDIDQILFLTFIWLIDNFYGCLGLSLSTRWTFYRKVSISILFIVLYFNETFLKCFKFTFVWNGGVKDFGNIKIVWVDLVQDNFGLNFFLSIVIIMLLKLGFGKWSQIVFDLAFKLFIIKHKVCGYWENTLRVNFITCRLL